LTLGFGGYTAQVTLEKLFLPIARRRRAHAEGAIRAAGEVWQASQRRMAGYLVHAGAVVVIVAIAVSSTMGTQKEASLAKGESLQLGGYTLTFLGAEAVSEPHREAIVARVEIKKGGEPIGMLYPRMNQYPSQREPIGTPAVRSSLFEDLYLSAMNIDPESQTLGLHAMINPMVGWIWGATAVMGAGGLLAMRSSRQSRAAAIALGAPVAEGALPHGAR
jgi:cytochrome c-type biogenesis protein CcmF